MATAAMTKAVRNDAEYIATSYFKLKAMLFILHKY